MRHFPRTLFSLLAGLLSIGSVSAHVVDWWPENAWGYTPANPMVFYYPGELSGRFYVDPSYLEPCTVFVNLNPSTSTLVNAQALPPDPDNSVVVVVQILRAPSNHLETATVTGEWHATGIPLGFGCDAITPNLFSVPITVTDQRPPFRITSINSMWVNISGPNAALQSSSCLTGPWSTIGAGQTFSVRRMMDSGFFRQTKQVGKFIGGYVWDNSGAPVSNLSIDLQYGGSKVFTDFSGSYSLSRLPIGLNWITLSNSVGASLNMGITNSDTTPTNSYTAAMIKAVIVAAPIAPPTNV